MIENGLDDAAMGELIKKSRVTVSRYRRKLETPSSEAVKDIVAACGGKVSANELLGIGPAGESAQIESAEAAP